MVRMGFEMGIQSIMRDKWKKTNSNPIHIQDVEHLEVRVPGP
jgi:hypothetical protein